jgi:hypothetical protein
MSYNPKHYDILIRPIFVKDGKEYIFEGSAEKERKTIEFRFIIKTLRKYFGDDIEFQESINKDLVKLTVLTDDEMTVLRNIYEDADVKYGLSHLKFEIISYGFDLPPCSGMLDCECRECFCNCKNCKY